MPKTLKCAYLLRLRCARRLRRLCGLWRAFCASVGVSSPVVVSCLCGACGASCGASLRPSLLLFSAFHRHAAVNLCPLRLSEMIAGGWCCHGSVAFSAARGGSVSLPASVCVVSVLSCRLGAFSGLPLLGVVLPSWRCHGFGRGSPVGSFPGFRSSCFCHCAVVFARGGSV